MSLFARRVPHICERQMFAQLRSSVTALAPVDSDDRNVAIGLVRSNTDWTTDVIVRVGQAVSLGPPGPPRLRERGDTGRRLPR